MSVIDVVNCFCTKMEQRGTCKNAKFFLRNFFKKMRKLMSRDGIRLKIDNVQGNSSAKSEMIAKDYRAYSQSLLSY